MITNAFPADIPVLCQMMHELVSHVQIRSKDVYICNVKPEFYHSFETWLTGSLSADDTQILIAKDNEKPIGFLMGSITRPYIQASAIEKIGLIDVCWIDSNYRNQGYAKQLTKAIEDWFRLKGIRFVDVAYLTGNTEAEKGWAALGYSPFRVESRKEI